MSQLASRYRPRRFDDVVGQEDEMSVLTTMMSKGWKPNAILYSGPFGVGKTTLARLTARAFLCENRKPEETEPCGACPSCKAMDKDNHPDYIEADAASQGLVLRS